MPWIKSNTAGRLFGLLLFVCAGQGLWAQNTGEDQLGAWYMYFGTNRVAEKWSIHTEAQFRFYDASSNFNQLLLRTGANYHLTDQAIVTLGYGYIWTDPTFEDGDALPDRILEHRIFQQFILKNKVGRLAFEHRYRLEQRFLDFDGPTETQHRARYRLQLTHPLGDTFFINFYDEVFINLQEPLFGQNRLYLALGARLSPAVSLQAGFLKNSFTGRDYNRLQLGVFFNPDLRKRPAAP
ncbi:DUF2490 domain-containing protein [Robiginitalea sp. M366]|uniref:DUF2490 domain-containing protein n=1 Tax=Robiginitalea aestuariiviva TaxID=3036903 RepID=UPI00240E173E|nr:DUF2490 domain-containing protein [Robiginitalea aestuariiviva]MDG1573419.1 DUF2490 domain-containing protein [Robiginitalea aestuariiviva]